MTLGVMQLVWDSSVPAPERFTLLALADRADETGECYPSVMYLCRKCATSERTIQRHLGTLEEMGVLTRKVYVGQNTHYTIELDVLRGMALPPIVRTVTRNPRQSGTPVNLTPPSDCPPTPVNLSSNPRQSDTQSVNNPKEHPREGARKRGTRLPDDFKITEGMVTWVRSRCPLVDGRMETERFTLYFQSAPGQKGIKVDWVKAWQNWMLGEQKNAAARGTRPPLHSVPKTPAQYGTFEAIWEAADVEFARRLIRANYLMPDQPYGDPLSPSEWRRQCARDWITGHEAQIRNALERKALA